MGKSPSDMKLFSEKPNGIKKSENNGMHPNDTEIKTKALKAESLKAESLKAEVLLGQEKDQLPFSGETTTKLPIEQQNERGLTKSNMAKAVIGSKIIFKGELSGDEDLLIQGQVEGTVKLNGNNLTIGKLGNVKADLSAKSITIDGTVEGDIVADEQIIINASSVITGNVIANRVTLEDGAKFRGSIEMDVES